eukprot:12732161-Alexandrium_andersonii.AAC.1
MCFGEPCLICTAHITQVGDAVEPAMRGRSSAEDVPRPPGELLRGPRGDRGMRVDAPDPAERRTWNDGFGSL